MIWATRSGCHVDRAACVWAIRRFLDPSATFIFVDDPDEVPRGATPFDMRGAALSHHDGRCSFETIVERHALSDPALTEIGRIVHEADLHDDRFDAPEAAGLDVLIRGLSMTLDDEALLQVTGPLFDGLYALKQRATIADRGRP